MSNQIEADISAILGLAAVMASAVSHSDFPKLMLELENPVWQFFAFFTTWFLETLTACLTHFKIFELTQVPALDGMSVAFVATILTML